MQAEKAAWGEPEEGAIWGDLGRLGMESSVDCGVAVQR